MTATAELRRMPLLRYALIGACFAVIWLALSLFASATSASADERDTGGGLLGAAGSVIGGATGVTGTVGGALQGVVDATVVPVQPVLEPIVGAAPEPVAEAIPAVVDTITETADGAISEANRTVGTLVNRITSGLSDAAGGSTIISPVAKPVDNVAGSLPIVRGLVGDGAVSGVLNPVTGLLDKTIGSTGDQPTDGTGILPHLPRIPLLPGDSGTPGLPGRPGTGPGAVTQPGGSAPPGLGEGGLLIEASDAGAGPAAARLADAGTMGSGLPFDGGAFPDDVPSVPDTPAVPAGTGFGGAAPGGAGAASTSDAAVAAFGLDALASLVLHAVDDKLPSSPVYDTDSTPD